MKAKIYCQHTFSIMIINLTDTGQFFYFEDKRLQYLNKNLVLSRLLRLTAALIAQFHTLIKSCLILLY